MCVIWSLDWSRSHTNNTQKGGKCCWARKPQELVRLFISFQQRRPAAGRCGLSRWSWWLRWKEGGISSSIIFLPLPWRLHNFSTFAQFLLQFGLSGMNYIQFDEGGGEQLTGYYLHSGSSKSFWFNYKPWRSSVQFVVLLRNFRWDDVKNKTANVSRVVFFLLLLLLRVIVFHSARFL